MMATTIRLSELCDLVTVPVNPASHANDLYVGLEHLTARRFLWIGVGKGSDVQSAKYAFRPGDVLYGKLRPYLDKAVLASASGICTTELLVLRPRKEVDARFVVCLLHAPGFLEHAIAGTTGAQHPRTSWNHIGGFELPSFDARERTKIADTLWEVHDSIVANEAAAEASARLKRVAMRTVFSRGLRGAPQNETEIGPVPDNWDVVAFESIREWLQYGTSVRCTYDTTEFPVLRIPNIETGQINTQDIKFAAISASDAQRYRLERGDLLFIRTNGVIERLGACAVYDRLPEGALFASYLIRARLKQNLVNPHFLAHFLGSEVGTSIVAGRATPAADGKYNLNTGTIDSLPVPLPPTLEEQNEIVAVLDSIDRKLDLHRRKHAVLDELFKVLLHGLMTGETRVADLDLGALDPKPNAEFAT